MSEACCFWVPVQAMAQATVLGSILKPLNALSACSLKKSDAFGTPVAVSVVGFGKRYRSPRIVVSRVTDTTTTTTTTVTSNEGASAKGWVPPGFRSVIAKVLVVRKPRPSREERMAFAMDVLTDLRGNKVKLQLVSEDVDPSKCLGCLISFAEHSRSCTACFWSLTFGIAWSSQALELAGRVPRR